MSKSGLIWLLLVALVLGCILGRWIDLSRNLLELSYYLLYFYECISKFNKHVPLD